VPGVEHEPAGTDRPVQAQETVVGRCSGGVGGALAPASAETVRGVDQGADLLIGHVSAGLVHHVSVLRGAGQAAGLPLGTAQGLDGHAGARVGRKVPCAGGIHQQSASGVAWTGSVCVTGSVPP
jgi:hypothetical protein